MLRNLPKAKQLIRGRLAFEPKAAPLATWLRGSQARREAIESSVLTLQRNASLLPAPQSHTDLQSWVQLAHFAYEEASSNGFLTV